MIIFSSNDNVILKIRTSVLHIFTFFQLNLFFLLLKGIYNFEHSSISQFQQFLTSELFWDNLTDNENEKLKTPTKTKNDELRAFKQHCAKRNIFILYSRNLDQLLRGEIQTTLSAVSSQVWLIWFWFQQGVSWISDLFSKFDPNWWSLWIVQQVSNFCFVLLKKFHNLKKKESYTVNNMELKLKGASSQIKRWEKALNISLTSLTKTVNCKTFTVFLKIEIILTYILRFHEFFKCKEGRLEGGKKFKLFCWFHLTIYILCHTYIDCLAKSMCNAFECLRF